MAKITIAGDAIVVTSGITLEGIKTIKKYRPKALKLMGGEDGKEEIFAIDVTNGSGSINVYGASFGCETHDDAKLATITYVPSGGMTGDVKEWVAERLGGAIMNLNKLEATLPAVLAQIAREKEAVMSGITVAQ